MACCRRSLLGQGRTLQNALLAAGKLTSPHQGVGSSPSEHQGQLHARSFSSLLSQWQVRRVPSSTQGKWGHSPIPEAFFLHHPLPARDYQQNLQAFSAQQVRHVYVEVIDNDLDSALKVFKRKMNNSKVEVKLKEKQYYSKPSECRKLAKHYKKLNRARRELGDKIRTVKHRMAKIQEVRKLEKDEKRAKAAAAGTNPSQTAG